MLAIRIVRWDWGSPISPTRVFLSSDVAVECQSPKGLFATTLRRQTAINTAKGVLRSRTRRPNSAVRRPANRMLLVEIDADDLIRHVGDTIMARRLRVVKDFTDDELRQIAAGDLAALDVTLQAA